MKHHSKRALSCALALSLFAVPVQAGEPISANRKRANQLFVAITGLRVGIDDPRVIAMEKLLDERKEVEAARIATQDPEFIDNRMYNFARRLYTTTESYNVLNNDFIATVMGMARDNLDAREMLTGNYYYEYDISDMDARNQTRFGPVLPAAGQPNNDHYDHSYSYQMSSFKRLKKTEPAMVFRGSTAPDPGGLLTTRTFIIDNATAGTNRRLVEYTFRSFMCVEMLDWADATRPDDMVGRDVDRFAGGGNTRYQTTCKGCHSQVDAFRPAFAYVKVTSRTPGYGAPVNPTILKNPQIFPGGFVVTNTNWKNYATGDVNMDRFGWRGNWKEGTGVNSFGKTISESRGFSRCMVRRMFYEVCKREPLAFEEKVVRSLADRFEKTYQFRDLAEVIALNPLCLSTGAQ